MARLKGDPIPEGHVARGMRGRVVNIGNAADAAYRTETARQRWLWNHFLAIQIDTYAILGEFVFYHEMARRLTHLRKANPWLGCGGIAAQQQTLRDLEKALKASFPNAAKRKGFPKFRKASSRHDRLTVPAVCVRTVRRDDGVITHVGVPNMPLLRVRNLRVPPGGRLTSFTVSQDGDGWAVSANMIAPSPAAVEPVVASLGVDMGIATLATAASADMSLVMEFDNIRPLKRMTRQIARSNRKMARRRKGSIGHRRAAREIARRNRKATNIRSGHHHRSTRTIVNATAHITVETLSVAAMMKTRLAKVVADTGLGDFLRKLRYKAEWSGRTYHQAGRYERSSGCCPDCSHVGSRIGRRPRSWICGSCGKEHERDLAAARWLDMVGRRTPEPDARKAHPKRGFAMTSGDGSPSSKHGSPTNDLHKKARRDDLPASRTIPLTAAV